MTAEIFSAVESGDAERVRAILAADPSAARSLDEMGATPLHYAAFEGHRKIVELLLQSGADVNARDGRYCATPAGWAIEYLREVGGVLGIEIEHVVFAIQENDVRWLRRLLTRLPALARALDCDGKPLAEIAAEAGNQEIVGLFMAAQAE